MNTQSRFVTPLVLIALSAVVLFAVFSLGEREELTNETASIHTGRSADPLASELQPDPVAESVTVVKTGRTEESGEANRIEREDTANLTFEGEPKSNGQGEAPKAEGEFEGNQVNRKNWFMDQRAYGLGYIPENARTAAKQKADIEAPSRLAGSSLADWDFIGPMPVRARTDTIYGDASGRINAIAVKPNDANVVLVGASTGGIWRSTNGGTQFSQATDANSSIVDIAVGTIAFAPSNSNVAYAGMGDRDGGYLGSGILKSTDEGASWNRIDDITLPVDQRLPGRGVANKIAVSPNDENRIYLALGEFPNLTNPQYPGSQPGSGFFLSTDGGVSWTKGNYDGGSGPIPLNGNVTDLVISPQDPNIVYAAVMASSVASPAPQGLYRSTDGGVNFTIVYTFAGGRDFRLAVSPLAPQKIYAFLPLNNIRVFTDDTVNPITWQASALASTQFDSGQIPYNLYLIADPYTEGRLYIGSRDIYQITINAADSVSNIRNLSNTWNNPQCVPDPPPATTCTWTWAYSPGTGKVHSDQQAFAFRGSSGQFYVGSDGGFQSGSLNPAGLVATFSSSLNATIGITQSIGVTIHPTNNNIIYTGTQDNGTQIKETGDQWFEFSGGDGGHVVVNPEDTSSIFASYVLGTLYRYSNNGSGSETIIANGTESGKTFAGYRSLFYLPLLGNGTDKTLYAGLNTLAICQNCDTTDGVGGSDPPNWTFPVGDLTRGGNDVISAIAVQKNAYSPNQNNHRVYTGSATGGFFASRSVGQNWINFTSVLDNVIHNNAPPASNPGRYITNLRIDPANANTVYITVSGYGSRHIFRAVVDFDTQNVVITPISYMMDASDEVPVNDFLIDPSIANVFYIATDIGVFQSFDAGATWNQFGIGMPPVVAMRFDSNENGRIVVATYGRGVYRLARPPATISGFVKTRTGNEPVAGVSVALTGTRTGTSITDANGYYKFEDMLVGGTYTVTPTHASYTFTPPAQTITNLPGSYSLATFQANSNADITGRVEDPGGLSLNGIYISANDLGVVAITGINGQFSITARQGQNYVVTPSLGFYDFIPSSQTVTELGNNTQLPVPFVGIAPPKVRGRVIDNCGLGEPGIVISAGLPGAQATTNADGYYEFAVPRGGSYSIAPLIEPGYVFTPLSQAITNINADVTLDDFHVIPPTFEYAWTGIAATTGPAFDTSWAKANNWQSGGAANGKYPRCNDYATIDTAGAVNIAGVRQLKRLTLLAGGLSNGSVTVSERMDWFGATAANQIAWIHDADLTIPENSELHLQGSNRKAMQGGVLKNQGTVVWTGEYISMNSTTPGGVCRFDNFGTVRLESTIDFQLFLDGGYDCTLNNKPGALITKPVVANYAPNTVFQQFSSFANAKLNNEGTIATNAGRMLILGSAEFKNGTRFEGSGVTLLNGGLATKKVSGTVTIANGATLETGIGGLDGYTYGGVTIEGTPAGSINTEGTGTFLVGSGTYFDGTINLNGKTDIEVTTGTFNPSASLETPNNGLDTINNNGTVNWRGNTLYIGSSVFNNHGTFNILSDDILQSQGSVTGVGSVFNNFLGGTVRKSNTSGVTDFMSYPYLSRFDNNGLVDVQSGKLLVHNGLSSGKFRTAANTEIEIQGNEMFTFLGANLESGGVFRNNGGTMSGSFRGTLQMLSGNVAGDMTALSPTPTLPGGTFDWRGGLIGNATFSPMPTTFMIQADAAMLIDASDQATFSGSFGNTVVTNNGVVQWTGQENTYIGVGDGGNNTGLIFHNNGTVFLQSDGTLFRHGDSSIFTFNNNASGVFKKSSGSGSTKLDVFGHDFNNFGTIEINSGVIEGGGVEFEFKNNSRIRSGGGRLSLNGGGGTSDAVGTVTLEGTGDPDNFVLELGGESNGVTLDGNGLTFLSSNSGGFLWTGGTIKGNVVLGSGLRTKIRSAGIVSNVTLDGSLSNAGTLAWEDGMDWYAGSSGNSSFTNLAGGTFDHQTAGILNNQSGFEFNFVNAGTMNIGGPTGVFNVSGSGVNAVNFANQTTGVVSMDIGGTADFDRLTAPAVMNLGGRLNVNFTGGFEPTVGDEFKIFDGQMTGMARKGAFSQVSVPSINGKSLRLDYNADDLTLQTAAVFIWSGAVDGNWNNPANWQGGQVPPSDGLVEIPETGVVNEPDLGSMSVNVANLVVSDGRNVMVGDGQTVTVDGVLKLDGGDIDTTGSSLRRRSQNIGGAAGGLLVIGANGAIDRTDGQVNGKMSKIFGGPSSFTFPVGTASGYSPVDLNVTAGNGEMTVEAKQGAHPNASVNSAILRYWTLQGSGITSNLTFHYLDADVTGMESLYQILKVSGGSSVFYPHSPPQVIVDAANNTGSINGVTSYSDWTMSANFGPTAATAAISGRLINASGNGIAKAAVTISGGNLTTPRQVKTSSFGYYRFDGLTVGETYVVTVGSKRYTFQTPSRLISLLDDAVDVDFTADQ